MDIHFIYIFKYDDVDIIFMYMMYHLYVHDVSSLCTWCIIFMYMMYHWRPQSIVLLFIHTFPKTYFSIFHKCIFTQSNVLYILSCLLPWSLRWLFKSDYFAVILKIQFILKKNLGHTDDNDRPNSLLFIVLIGIFNPIWFTKELNTRHKFKFSNPKS